VIIYRAVPFLLIAAPPAVLLLTVLVLGGCTMARTAEDTASHTGFYSDPNSHAGQELTKELDRRAMREELRRVSEEAQR
jgi:hypothetical protein